MTCGIYAISCIKNEKVYVGQSIDMRSRWFDHRKRLRGGRHYNSHLQNSWNKYGECSFVFSEVVLCDSQDLSKMEQEVADSLKLSGVALFNVGSYLPSPAKGLKREDNSKRLREMHADPERGAFLRRGITERMSRLKGTDEAKVLAKNAFLARIAKYPIKEKPKKLSKEEKRILCSAAAKKNLVGKFARVRPILIDNVGVFNSASDAAIFLKTKTWRVRHVLKGDGKVNGFSIKYAGECKMIKLDVTVAGARSRG